MPIQDGVYAYMSVCVYITIYIINYYLYYKYIYIGWNRKQIQRIRYVVNEDGSFADHTNEYK